MLSQKKAAFGIYPNCMSNSQKTPQTPSPCFFQVSPGEFLIHSVSVTSRSDCTFWHMAVREKSGIGRSLFWIYYSVIWNTFLCLPPWRECLKKWVSFPFLNSFTSASPSPQRLVCHSALKRGHLERLNASSFWRGWTACLNRRFSIRLYLFLQSTHLDTWKKRKNYTYTNFHIPCLFLWFHLADLWPSGVCAVELKPRGNHRCSLSKCPRNLQSKRLHPHWSAGLFWSNRNRIKKIK